RGSALMAAFWMLVILLVAGLAASFSTTTEIELSGNQRVQAQLFYLAEGGVAQVKKYLDGLGTPFEGSGPTQSAPVQVNLETPIGGVGVSGRFTAYVDRQNNLQGKPTKFLAITVRAQMQGNPMSAVIQEMVGQDNFAKYAYFTDQETSSITGGIVWFKTGDILRGPVHSNDQFNIDGDPIYLKEVTTSASSVNYAAGVNNPDFREGITFNVDPVELPGDTGLIMVKSQEADGLYFAGNQTLELAYEPATDYAYVIVDPAGAATEYQLPLNGVIYVDGDCEIEGTLHGQLTVACSGDMYLTDDILYTTDPRVDPSSTDLLGLVADGNVYVAATAENLDAGDETFMCVLMALGTSFAAENYASGSPRGYLRVIGGIIQDQRGPVGTFNPSTGNIVSGYDKDYVYDGRLADSPPPAFPTTGIVVTLAWKQLDPSVDISSDVF
ncbi:DUF4900 domain-containing protein, partial [Gemmatimonadota bacterium]